MQKQTAFTCKFLCIRDTLGKKTPTNFIDCSCPNNWHTILIFPFSLNGGMEGRRSFVFFFFFGGGGSLLSNSALIVIYCSVSFTVLAFSRAEETYRNTNVYFQPYHGGGGHTFQLATH